MKNISLIITSIIFITACRDNNYSSNTNVTPPENPEPEEEFVEEEKLSEKDKKFIEKFKQKYPDYITLAPEVLAKLVRIIPAQTTTWGCGLHQSEAAIETAYINTKKKRAKKTDFDQVCEYPLAIDLNINNILIHNIINMFASSEQKSQLQKATDSEGNFRVGALPHDLSAYINKNLPSRFAYTAQAVSKENLSLLEFFEIIQDNLKIGMPTPIFYVIDKQKLRLHIYSIVGYTKDILLILDTTGENTHRFFAKNTNDFLQNMNTQDIRTTANLFAGFRNLIKEDIKIASEDSYTRWKAYSLIKFIKI